MGQVTAAIGYWATGNLGNWAQVPQIMWKYIPKVIHSLQLHVSHQMRSYSCQDHLTIELHLFFGYLGIRAILEKSAQTPLIKYRVTQKEIQSLQVLISHQMRPYASVRALREFSYTCFTDTRVLGNLGKLGPNTQNHVQGHLKSNPKFQLLVSHQIRPYSSIRALCGSSYACFTGTRVLGQFGENGSKYPKSCTGTHEKSFKVFRLLFYIK